VTWAGVVFGLAVHLRIYPIIYALSIYLYTDKHSSTFITKNRLKLAFSAALSFLGLIAGFYLLFGWEFLYETYLYHFVRKDNRHNFSLYFYLLYLTFDTQATWVGLLAFIPQWAVNIYISFRRSRQDLPLTLVA
jgi:phosphatidylinositol glycan class M